MDQAQGFEVTEYDPEDLPVAEQLSVLKQIMQDRKHDPTITQLPSEAFLLTLQGNQLRLGYHCYEMNLGEANALRELDKVSQKALNDVLKYLKKEFKKRTKKSLSVKEVKDKRDYSVQKTSLNSRYYYVSWRVFSIDLAVR